MTINKEINQGVGYLDDGTMVVVEDGREYVERKTVVVVTKVLHDVFSNDEASTEAQEREFAGAGSIDKGSTALGSSVADHGSRFVRR